MELEAESPLHGIIGKQQRIHGITTPVLQIPTGAVPTRAPLGEVPKGFVSWVFPPPAVNPVLKHDPDASALEQEAAYFSKRPNSIVFWIPTPFPNPGEALPKPDHFVIPLAVEQTLLEGYLGRDFAERELRLYGRTSGSPIVRIGFTPIAPNPVEWGFGGAWWEGLNSEESYHPFFGRLETEPFILGSYELPILWYPSPHNYDRLVVGSGNYMPRKGDVLYEETKQEREWIAEFEALAPAAKAIVLAEDQLREEIWAEEMELRLVKFGIRRSKYGEMIPIKDAMEEVPCFHPGGCTKVEGELIAFYRAKIEKLKEEMEAIPGPFDPPPIALKDRRGRGPFMNGVSKWAYRFSLRNPPPPLPDLTKTPGYLLIEFSGPPGFRWLGGTPPGAWPAWDPTPGHIPPSWAYEFDRGLETHESGLWTPSTGRARVASVPA